MGFGSEVLFIIALVFLLLGPKQLPAILEHIAHAKAQLKSATHNFASELNAALETSSRQQVMDSARERVKNCDGLANSGNWQGKSTDPPHSGRKFLRYGLSKRTDPGKFFEQRH